MAEKSDLEKAAQAVRQAQRDYTKQERDFKKAAQDEAKRREQAGYKGTQQAVQVNQNLQDQATQRFQMTEVDPQTGLQKKKTSFSINDLKKK